MNEANNYSIKDFFDFWRKCECVYNIFKKIFWTTIILGAIFCLIFIPLQDKNPTPIAGLIVFLIIGLAFVIEDFSDNYKEKIHSVVIFMGLINFIYSYFLIIPLGNDYNVSFLTDNSCKLKSYGSYQLFHIPLYGKHFIYNTEQQRSFDDIYGNSKIIIDLEFDFEELFKNNKQILVSKESFNTIIDEKVRLVNLFIRSIGLPKDLSKISHLNDPWLKITSLKIEFKSNVLR